MTDVLKMKDGVLIGHVPNGMAPDEFVGITENPFGHGCCDCGLWHRVEIYLADKDGNVIPLPEETIPAMRWVRDEEQTEYFRREKMSPAAAALSLDLAKGVTAREVAITSFSDVPINDLDRDALLRIITLLAAGKRQEDPSRIIRV